MSRFAESVVEDAALDWLKSGSMGSCVKAGVGAYRKATLARGIVAKGGFPWTLTPGALNSLLAEGSA